MLIGVTGPIASGKDVLANSLLLKGYQLINFSDEVRQEARDRNLPIERKNLQDLGNEMRRNNGNNYWAKRILSKLDLTKNYVLVGIRNPAEIVELRKTGKFFLIGINAPVEKRIEWIKIRNKPSDPKTIEEIMQIEARDRGVGEDISGQQVTACYNLADYYIYNEGSLEELKDKSLLMLKQF